MQDLSSSSEHSAQEPTVAELMEYERSLKLEDRRPRYACGASYVTPAQIPTWAETIEEYGPKVATVEADEAVEGVEVNPEVNAKVCLMQGDITSLELDAVVNAANERLLGGGGIDGAIHRAAGHNLYRECKTLGGTPTGTTKLTLGYNLPARYVLHTVGPVGQGEDLLRSSYRTVMELVGEHDDIRTVALCGVSTGIFGFDLRTATDCALSEVRRWLDVPENRAKVDKVVFCTFLDRELACYRRRMAAYFPALIAAPKADEKGKDE